MQLVYKFGFHRQVLEIDEGDDNIRIKIFNSILQKFGDQGYSLPQLCFFRHNELDSEYKLQVVGEEDRFLPGDIIEIVISASAEPAKKDYLQHDLAVKSYRLPAFCDRCGQMLMGLVKQGLQCKRCTRNYHKRCVYLLRECTPKSPEDHESGSDNFSSSESLVQSADSGSAVSGSMSMSVPHHWVVHSYRLPTVCQFCSKLLMGLIRQGVRCKDCKYNAHRDCSKKIGDNCQGDMLYIFTNSETNASTIVNDFSVNSNSTLEDLEEHPEHGDESGEAGPLSEQMIPVQRLCVSIRRTHRRESKMIKQGWMNVKFDLSEKLGGNQLPVFAVLSSKNITFYESESPETHYLKDLALNDIHFLEVESTTTNGALFDIHTNHGLISVFPHVLKVDGADENSVVEIKTDQNWSDAIVQAMMPAYNKEERKHRCGSVKRSTGSSYSGSRKKKAVEQMSFPTIDKRDISEVFQIFIDDMVGSGQFGAVYGAIHRQTGRKAAVKIIKKEQFGQQRRNIENEVKILKRATFPCVVEMLNTFETDGKLFVVMERMHSDMLEMILNSSQGRLDERSTALLMVQVMFALKYLHSLAIVHCDLKPENVLLAEPHSMPLVKLCDFGYARIIDVNQFRQSMVGTPAYLAPEVISHCNWDRNIDVWAAGVVMYVTLSGTFPFNEDEDICDQINNASFMYPSNPWKQITTDAVDLLNHMLVVKPHDRFDVHKTLSHRFLSNSSCLTDLTALEARHGVSITN
ncbi:serine/threonine-protein kinase D1-like isoform X9 [Bolinopsis microptera]|uniref:serine/threonine-protein kinase D1-like isoform X9 n=1 Tax=Bolinopsis microptera TaxID=2820187 RepID=UPI0030792F5D